MLPRMAFDGPGPFDGDPSVMMAMELEDAPEDAEAIFEEALCTALEQAYVEVDDGVLAWVAVEMIAHHAGAPGPVPLEGVFARVTVKDVSDLRPLALEALEWIAEPDRSELAELWNERGEGPLRDRLAELRTRLSS